LLVFAVSLSGQTVHSIWNEPVIEGLAAKVNDDIITFEQVRGEMAPLIPSVEQEARSKEEFEKKMDQLYVETVQYLIDRRLIVKDFADKKFSMPQGAVENEYSRTLIEDFNNDRASFHKHLDAIGKNDREFRNDIRERIIVIGLRQNQRKTAAEISPEKIQKYYNDNQNKYFQEEALHLRVIMLKPIGDESKDLMRQQVDAIMTDLASGKSFEEVAKVYSQDSRRTRGGDWGWITRQDLNSSLADMAFAIKAGQHSEPVKVGRQTFILYVEERRAEGIQPLADVRDKIESELADEQTRLTEEAWLQRLRKKAYIKYY
jgi:peptidyl-prolyl cis-trans isomerase SurA